MNNNEASVLDMIFGSYSEHDHEESDAVKQGFYELDSLLEHFPEEMIDPVMYTVCDLCHAHEREGFLMGVRVGIRLLKELGF